MRNLVLFFTRNYYTLLFLSLETLAVFLIIQNNHFQRAHFLNSSNAVSGSIYQTYSGITDYFGLRKTNEFLAAENTQLRNQLREAFEERSESYSLKEDSTLRQKYLFLNAKVVNNSTNRRKNYLTLNIGSNQGVKKDMAVIGGEGVVGIVRDVSENFCSAMSLLHESMRVPVTIKKYGENTILTWDGKDESLAVLERIPSHLLLKKGDVIETSSYSSIFPVGIPVGTVESFENIAGNTFYNVTIRLSTNFSRLSHVKVVNNLMKDEQVTLEKESQND